MDFAPMYGRARTPWFALASLLLAACATGANGATALPPPAPSSSFHPTRLAPDDSDQVLRGPVLERAAYVRAVLQRNASIESARQGWRAAVARARQAGEVDDPMVNVGIAPLSIGSSSARLGYEVGIHQRLPWFGKRALERDAASAEAGAAKGDFEATKRELALAASSLYDQYFVTVRSLAIHEEHIRLMRTLHAGALAQFEAGRAMAHDPLQAEAELAHLEHDVVVLASRRDVTVAQMNELLHRAPELPLPSPPNELALPPAPSVAQAARDVRDGRDSERLREEALARRPEITAARERERAEVARAERGRREYYPDVTVSTSYNAMWDMPEHRWMVGLAFPLPIQTGRRAGAVDEADAARARMASEVAHLRDMARTQVFVAVKQLEESEHLVRSFEARLLPVARSQIDAARAGFVASQSSFSAVIEAERGLRRAELEYQVARADCDRRHAELERALGRIPGLGEPGQIRIRGEEAVR
ncbi:TolC family protein [Pendulispora albinea]|uniref:TolC family protein n=1 Tax=Pendulispora albinea TaxID=2741071 RepID=A0ABZ2LQJ9_9BACT